jgi:hypothetical protein
MTAGPAEGGSPRRAPAPRAAARRAQPGQATAKSRAPARRPQPAKTTAAPSAARRPARPAARATARPAHATARPAQRAVAKAIEQEAGHLVLPYGIGPVRVPSPDRLAFYGGIAALALIGIVDWPVALVIGVGHLLADDHHHKLLADFGEALGEA